MTMPAATAPVFLRCDGAIADIVFNAPERRNAFSQKMWAALPGLIAEAESASTVKTIIMHGGESGHFAAGADISEFETIYADDVVAGESADTIANALNAIAGCEKPVIAAIEGVCIGGGVSLALAADIRIASQRSRFGVTPAKLGLVYPADDMRRLVQAVGSGHARDILFTGAIFDAQRAQRIGLVEDLCPEGTALDHARNRAEMIGEVSQYSVREMKRLLSALTTTGGLSDEDGRQAFIDTARSEHFRAGYRAFLDKRKAEFPNP
ncbi:enoyl-CoA hydratase-related protein [Henriciella sp.]|uniref:enoyl-CoA hydratase/isomerase family protein n=1 Tax=Henriciella sp. TaxID=1968823 RepID=UPI002614E3A3|nr:enoyl-CoA hydratase-related protein [Henriciella sp.]